MVHSKTFFMALVFCGLPLFPFLPVGCNRSGQAVPSPLSEKAGTVTTVKPERRTLRRVIEQPAQVLAFEETPLVARIAGYINKVHVDIGARVLGPVYDSQGKLIKPGQVLAELWVPELEEELKQKQAHVGQAQAEVAQAQASLEAAEANVHTAQAYVREAAAARSRAEENLKRWESEYKRIEALVQRNVIAEQTRDETRNQYKSAEASREEVEAKVLSAQAMARESEAKRNKAKADLTAAQARVQVAQADQDRAAAMLAYSKICAPFDGVVTQRNIHTGHFLQPATAKGADPLFVVARTDILRIVAEVPETEASYIQNGTPARIRVQALKDQEFPGKVTRSSWTLDARARTLRTEIDFSNHKAQMRPGMYAYVAFDVDLPDRLTLPLASLRTVNDQPCCFLVEGNKAHLTPLKLGQRDGAYVEVLQKQVKSAQGNENKKWVDFSGQEIVIGGNLSSLTDGQTVQVSPGDGK